MRRLALVVNPAAGHGRARRLAPRVEQRLADAGVRVTTTIATSADHAHGACADAVADGVDGVVVLGGDGMAHLGLNACAGTDVPLGVVPAGTGNDFARGIGVRGGWSGALEAIVADTTRRIDLAEVTGSLYHGELEYVGCVVSTGFDEKVNFRANHSRLDLGKLSYLGAVFAEVRHFKPCATASPSTARPARSTPSSSPSPTAASSAGASASPPTTTSPTGCWTSSSSTRCRSASCCNSCPRSPRASPSTTPRSSARVRQCVVDGDDLYGMADGEPLGRPPLTVTAAPGALRIFSQEA